MIFVSTRGRAGAVGLREALFSGTAPDGGLYVPDSLTPLPRRQLAEFPARGFPEIALRIAGHLFGDEVPRERLADIVADSLDFDIPLEPVEPRTWSLELFHGPTLAFKDVGARFMSRLMAHFRSTGDRPLTVLVATSGDTGSAIAHAFHRLDGIRVVVLFPAGKVSPRQRKQFSTLGGNIRALAVEGAFDDCQDLVKRALGDPGLRERTRLGSANSINVGRLLPQIFYYFHAAARLPEPREEAVISVPSGNFGNLTAGLMARRLGLACARMVAATNRNDAVPRFLASGQFRPHPTRPTLSNAMDVGNPSNWERIRHLYGGDREALGRDLLGFAVTDPETRRAICEVHSRTGRFLDPHSAVGYLGLRKGRERHPGSPGIFLATAHPAKFPEVIEEETGAAPPLPDRLRECLERPESVQSLPADYPALREFLLSGE